MPRTIRITIMICMLVLTSMFCALASRATPLRDVFEAVNPAVVVIHTVQSQAGLQADGGLTSVSGLGSGFVISSDGLVITAAHVIQTSETLEVEFLDGTTVPAQVVQSDPSSDLALLRLESTPPGMINVELGDSDLARVGDQIFIIGAPFGVGHTLTVGHVSGRHRSDRSYGGLFEAEMLQTDAAINPGNSGGPMFDMEGKVVGVVSHIMSQSGGSEGIGFVITSNLARRLLLEESGIWSGLEGLQLEGELAALLNVPEPGAGLLVLSVAKNSLAYRMGLKGGTHVAVIDDTPLLLGGDIILEVMDIPLDQPNRVREAMRKLKRGNTLRVVVLRGGKQVRLKLTITSKEIKR
jgi:serine protease Do